MSRRQIWLAASVLVLVVIGTMLLFDSRQTASASTLSVGARGWIAARLYLEERGHDVTLLDRPLHESQGLDVLVLTLPWQRWPRPDERRGVDEHLGRGETVVLAYSGESSPAWGDEAVDWLGLEWETLRGDPPLSPRRFWDFVTETWDLRGGETLAGVDLPEVRIGALARAPRAPRSARVLYRAPGGTPVVYELSHLGGRVVVLPADLFANARITEAGNADVLESLARSLGDGWSFDEYHHGLSAPLSAEQRQPRIALDLLLVHLGLLYALALWRLGRPFGPTWRDEPVTTGSAGSFLLGVGALHDRLGHYREAAALMVRRARELNPRLSIEAEGDAASAKELVALGRELASRQRATKETS